MPNIDSDELYQEYINKVYQDTSGYLTYSQEEKDHFANTHVCTTYGELLYPGAKKLISHMKLTPDDVFLDLGSGLGKCALQVFMQTDVGKCIGIEGAKAVYDQALKAIEEIKSDFPQFWEKGRELNFVCDNFIHADWQKATSVYTCSTSFTQELLVAIAAKVNQSDTVRQVFSLRSIPDLDLPLKEVFEVECSWDTSSVYHYAK